jgi:hypothetical protein
MDHAAPLAHRGSVVKLAEFQERCVPGGSR